MYKNISLAVFVTLCLQACAPPPSTTRNFDEADIAWSRSNGTGIVSGQGFMRQQGGSVVTCAGEDVQLFPVSAYSTERMMLLYASSERGTNNYRNISGEVPLGYQNSTRKAICNAQGNFKIGALPVGN